MLDESAVMRRFVFAGPSRPRCFRQILVAIERSVPASTCATRTLVRSGLTPYIGTDAKVGNRSDSAAFACAPDLE